MGLDALLGELESRVVVGSVQEGNKDGQGVDDGVIPLPATAPAGKRQISCRAFEVTRILMATKPGHCLDRQGDHCGNCVLRQAGAVAGF